MKNENGLVKIHLVNQETKEVVQSQWVHPEDHSFLEYLTVEAQNAFSNSLKWELEKSEEERMDEAMRLLGYFL